MKRVADVHVFRILMTIVFASVALWGQRTQAAAVISPSQLEVVDTVVIEAPLSMDLGTDVHQMTKDQAENPATKAPPQRGAAAAGSSGVSGPAALAATAVVLTPSCVGRLLPENGGALPSTVPRGILRPPRL